MPHAVINNQTDTADAGYTLPDRQEVRTASTMPGGGSDQQNWLEKATFPLSLTPYLLR